MAKSPHNPDEAATHLEAFLTAGIADLCRLVELRGVPGLCLETRPPTQVFTARSRPVSPVAAQLALYLLLVSRGLQPKHKALYPRCDRLRDLLRRVYRKALKSWDEGNLCDIQGLQPAVRTLARFARRTMPGFEYSAGGLEAFGVKSVRVSLAILTEKLAMNLARELAKAPVKAPPELVGASLVASATSPGVIEKIGNGHTVTGLMRLGVWAGLTRTRSGGNGTQTSGLEELRKFLKRVDKPLDQ